ncbi:ribosomal protein S16 [Laetiporus sulphureus 93-53]|uniref:Ribosomal protein S16 n=1 Tax=Laetiporus sulphureus 93-53 TaxID=1314785 RepID=A0A165DY88_9APHY|nr:ribosomal protein S16 [Laetiporus sulphureus 93-53]KZT05863.1 ribosomal protein S16 [Laetiporus sulphureus 93-53]
MVVRIRFSLHGPPHRKIFHLVAIENRTARDSKPIELLGIYNPQPRPNPGQQHKTMQWSPERIRYWLSVGAQPSKTVERLLVLGGVIKESPSSDKETLSTPSSSENPGIKIDDVD